MKINEYYRDTANINLNGSIAALVPAIMIVAGNLSFFKSDEVMLLTIPFLIYSLISFQFYLFRLRQSISISRNMGEAKNSSYSIASARNLLVFYMSTPTVRLYLYFPDGHLAGVLKKHDGKWLDRLKFRKMYVLYNSEEEPIGFYKVQRGSVLKIEVYNEQLTYLGCYKRESNGFLKDKKEILDETGKTISLIQGATAFMDEKVLDQSYHQQGRLRRGWMPVSWSPLFPEPNTPVLSFREVLSEKDKLLKMSLLINEYFIER
ncbi:hypothetical protein ABES03_23460 [Neobacillus rhizosphaerae]|uniref:hypothetical protein n=1 Tax=Neobacillus rhizosphaerae TaxID=2880965 RepID=UPI003D2D064A